MEIVVDCVVVAHAPGVADGDGGRVLIRQNSSILRVDLIDNRSVGLGLGPGYVRPRGADELDLTIAANLPPVLTCFHLCPCSSKPACKNGRLLDSDGVVACTRYTGGSLGSVAKAFGVAAPPAETPYRGSSSTGNHGPLGYRGSSRDAWPLKSHVLARPSNGVESTRHLPSQMKLSLAIQLYPLRARRFARDGHVVPNDRHFSVWIAMKFGGTGISLPSGLSTPSVYALCFEGKSRTSEAASYLLIGFRTQFGKWAGMVSTTCSSNQRIIAGSACWRRLASVVEDGRESGHSRCQLVR